MQEGLAAPPSSPVKKKKKEKYEVNGKERRMIVNIYKNMQVGEPDVSRATVICTINENTGIGRNIIKNAILEYERTGEVKSPIWRRRYLREIRKFREEGRSIYYLEKTWLNTGDVSSKAWFDGSIKSHKDAFLRGLKTGAPNPTGKGKRLIILHIGSEKGFVPGGLLCFESKKHSADYRDEMNGVIFREWFNEILPRLDDNYVIVIDDASYHSVKAERVPNSS
ncbi:uncharacterized protein LOC117176656 [Belonocnema kinseyi]|uniref:uncharacterized protein LOC117176656 n=1 Tax=Belonocnema kinseyi TaxID=2817044 RepID=UPI00143D248D|nr:uncharacterized protein LOC117176656 [Belonocnema kinseyi]